MEQTTPRATSDLGLKADFPIFKREWNGKPLIYLDSGATSQKPAQVIDAIDSYYREHNANIHRGAYPLAAEATELFEGARKRIAEFVGGDRRTTIFTRNATEAINLVAYAWGADNIGPGDVILITTMEHHSNTVPWQQLCERTGAELRYIDVDERGLLRADQLSEELATGDVKLLSVTHVSNVLGTINPVTEIVAEARRHGVTTLIDGSQAVPQMPVDLSAIDADFYVWTGHKAVGPTGIGVLHGRREILDAMRPFITGGDMIKSVEPQTSTWNDLPWKFEAGTSPIAEAVGLGAAVDYLSAVGMERIRRHEHELTNYAQAELEQLPGVTTVGPPLSASEARGGLVTFVVDGVHPHDVAELVARDGVCVRAGHHCAQPLMRRLGVPATTRASFGPYNVAADVDSLISSLRAAQAVFAD